MRPDTFFSRAWYGHYLQRLLEDASRNRRIEYIAARLIDILPVNRGVHLLFDRALPLRVDRVVIAGGNLPPSEVLLGTSDLSRSKRYIPNPWQRAELQEITPDASVLLIGTGLTMVDVILELEAAGLRGTIHALSRRGLLPQSHRASRKDLPPLTLPPEVGDAPRSASGLLRGLRLAIRRLQRDGYDWRDVMTSLRASTPGLWSSLGLRERKQFLRHLRPYWDTHRHRVPSQVASHLEALRQSGRLQVHKGRLVDSRDLSEGHLISWRARDGSGTHQFEAAWIINCTGPDADIRRADDPLWANLQRSGLVESDPLGLGVLTNDEGAVLDSEGNPSEWLHLVGPLRKAQLWESTAVPELRMQAAAMARHLATTLDATQPVPAHEANTWLESVQSSADGLLPAFIGENI